MYLCFWQRNFSFGGHNVQGLKESEQHECLHYFFQQPQSNQRFVSSTVNMDFLLSPLLQLIVHVRPQKKMGKNKLTIFSACIFCNFSVRTLNTMYRNSWFFLMSPRKHENPPSKVAYFSFNCRNFSTAKNDPVCPDSWKLTQLFQCFLYLVQIFESNQTHSFFFQENKNFWLLCPLSCGQISTNTVFVMSRYD